MLKISLKEGQYVNIGDDIRVVYVGRSGSNGKLMIEAPKELRISRSVEDVDGKKYYADPKPLHRSAERNQTDFEKRALEKRNPITGSIEKYVNRRGTPGTPCLFINCGNAYLLSLEYFVSAKRNYHTKCSTYAMHHKVHYRKCKDTCISTLLGKDSRR